MSFSSFFVQNLHPLDPADCFRQRTLAEKTPHDGQWSADGSSGDEDDEDEECLPPDHDDPRRWDQFGAEFDDDEPDPEPGDFWPDDDGLDQFAKRPGLLVKLCPKG